MRISKDTGLVKIAFVNQCPISSAGKKKKSTHAKFLKSFDKNRRHVVWEFLAQYTGNTVSSAFVINTLLELEKKGLIVVQIREREGAK